MRVRLVVLWGVVASLCLGAAFASSALAGNGSRFRRIAGPNVTSVAASGHYAFYVTTRLGPAPEGGSTEISATGTLVNERTGRRRRLMPPNCPRDPGVGMFGGPWLLVECDKLDASGLVPVLSLYDLSHGTWEAAEPAENGGGAADTCAEAWAASGGCQIVGVGSRWIEFETNAYHGENQYYLQPIPSGQPVEPAAVTPGGTYAFDLNAASGARALCRPLDYPIAPWYGPESVGTQPGWIDPLGKVALVSDTFPGQNDWSYVSLARCGKRSRERLHPNSDVAFSRSAVAWWRPKYVKGVQLPSGKPFSLRLPAKVKYDGDTPIVAVSDRRAYIAADGHLWQAPLPR